MRPAAGRNASDDVHAGVHGRLGARLHGRFQGAAGVPRDVGRMSAGNRLRLLRWCRGMVPGASTAVREPALKGGAPVLRTRQTKVVLYGWCASLEKPVPAFGGGGEQSVFGGALEEMEHFWKGSGEKSAVVGGRAFAPEPAFKVFEKNRLFGKRSASVSGAVGNLRTPQGLCTCTHVCR